MKAWKYGLTLVLGLSMGLGAQVFAQASGQTQEVVPNNPNTLPEEPAATAGQDQIDQQVDEPQRGVPTPKVIENLVDKQEYAKAVEEFEKFIKTAKGNPCDLIYLRVSFYDRLALEDTSKAKAHQTKRDGFIKELEGKCAQMPDLYVLKARLDSDQSPEAAIRWMTKAIAVDPSYSFVYDMRGNAYWMLGQTEKACADFKKAKELDSNYTNYYYDTQCPQLSEATSNDN